MDIETLGEVLYCLAHKVNPQFIVGPPWIGPVTFLIRLRSGAFPGFYQWCGKGREKQEQGRGGQEIRILDIILRLMCPVVYRFII